MKLRKLEDGGGVSQSFEAAFENLMSLKRALIIFNSFNHMRIYVFSQVGGGGGGTTGQQEDDEI